MAPTRITLVAHTHWDREWYEPFEIFRAHLVEMLDDALDHLERDPRLQFTLDGHVALVDDYLELRPHPEVEERLRRLVKAGRLHIGPFYTQADTLLADGESLIRNLAEGIRRAEHLGGAMRIGYMPDQFGHAAQIPQILRLFGIDGAVLWRGVGPERPPHAFHWVSPNGSKVTVLWLQDGYGSGRRFPSDPEGFADAVLRSIGRLDDWLGEMPVLIPVGDDHVKLAAWLPEAARAVAAKRPQARVIIGGYHDHLPALGPISHVVEGELRSPAFAPVLAGVASARIREKQAGAHATDLLLRYAEPLCAWADAGENAHRSRLHSLLQRAWRQLLLNQAHDSAAGCGVDLTHEDVKARYRWAKQLGEAALRQALGRLSLEKLGEPQVTIFTPHGSPHGFTVEAALPRALVEDTRQELVAVGLDGCARPVQLLNGGDEPPIFEGEFAKAELEQYLGGLDPATPLFGRYLAGIDIYEEKVGLYRLDVGLGDRPVPKERLEADHEAVRDLMPKAERFRVVLHAAGPSRPALVQTGPTPEAGFVQLLFRRGAVDRNAQRVSARGPVLENEHLVVRADPDGTVTIEERRLGFAVRAHDLVDEGDRGDLYHFDPAGTPVRAREVRLVPVESGPVRAQLRIDLTFDLPVSLTVDRSKRSPVNRPTTLSTLVTLSGGERRVEFVTTFENQTFDHRLRVLFHLPFSPQRLDVDHGLAVVARPLDPRTLGAGSERPAATGQHHGFCDVADARRGVALMSRGLLEHELTAEGHNPILGLTLLRSVGWLSRGDLSVIDHAAGPMVPTPSAQELGMHRFEYATLLHEGDWRQGGVMSEARRYAAPPMVVTPSGRKPTPCGQSFVEVEPASVVLTALHPSATTSGVVVRLLNTAPEPVIAQLRPATSFSSARMTDPLERPLERDLRERESLPDLIRVPLEPWQIATVVIA
jgi:mannosylglycerate hydrolase